VQVPIVLCGVVPIYNLKNLHVSQEPKKEEVEKLATELSAKDAPKASLEKLEQILGNTKFRDAIVVQLAEIKAKLPDEQAKKNLDWAVTKAQENLAKPVNFTAEVLAKIFLGEIKDWDDKQLQDLNPGVKLPKHKITVVHRKDSSGTTQIFTDYQQGASKVWQEKIGKAGSTVKWPVGEAMDRNNGVAHFVSLTDGAIGYVDLLFAKARQGEIDYGAIQNKEGKFIHAEPANLTAATKELVNNIPDNLSFKLTNKGGADSYPITGVIWAMCYQNQPTANHKTLVEFLHYLTHEGQQLADKKMFAQLPPEIISRVDEKIKTIKPQ
jgi:phosphate transport system substrate-binding protein